MGLWTAYKNETFIGIVTNIGIIFFTVYWWWLLWTLIDSSNHFGKFWPKHFVRYGFTFHLIIHFAFFSVLNIYVIFRYYPVFISPTYLLFQQPCCLQVLLLKNCSKQFQLKTVHIFGRCYCRVVSLWTHWYTHSFACFLKA